MVLGSRCDTGPFKTVVDGKIVKKSAGQRLTSSRRWGTASGWWHRMSYRKPWQYSPGGAPISQKKRRLRERRAR